MKKLLHIGGLVGMLGFILLWFGGCWGWGWFVPYNFQPSYHKFKKMCKLNELPNNEEKYNKILGYFDTDLDSLDWEELNREAQKYYDTRIVIDYRAKQITHPYTNPINKGRLGLNYIFYTQTINKVFPKIICL